MAEDHEITCTRHHEHSPGPCCALSCWCRGMPASPAPSEGKTVDDGRERAAMLLAQKLFVERARGDEQTRVDAVQIWLGMVRTGCGEPWIEQARTLVDDFAALLRSAPADDLRPQDLNVVRPGAFTRPLPAPAGEPRAYEPSAAEIGLLTAALVSAFTSYSLTTHAQFAKRAREVLVSLRVLRAPVAPAEPWTAEDAKRLEEIRVRVSRAQTEGRTPKAVLDRAWLLARLAPAPAETRAVTDGVAGGEGADGYVHEVGRP